MIYGGGAAWDDVWEAQVPQLGIVNQNQFQYYAWIVPCGNGCTCAIETYCDLHYPRPKHLPKNDNHRFRNPYERINRPWPAVVS